LAARGVSVRLGCRGGSDEIGVFDDCKDADAFVLKGPVGAKSERAFPNVSVPRAQTSSSLTCTRARGARTQPKSAALELQAGVSERLLES
jgi:hypothetical protein